MNRRQLFTGADIFAEAEEMARKEADKYDEYLKSPAGQSKIAERIQADIRKGIRDETGEYILAEDNDDEPEDDQEEDEDLDDEPS